MTVHQLAAHRRVPEREPGHATTGQPVKRVRRRLGVSWATIILFAVVISYVNGFWVTSLQGAVGSLERSEPPFQRWLAIPASWFRCTRPGCCRGAARTPLVRP